MSRDFPDWVNPWTAAAGRRVFSGTMSLARMPRLAVLLAVADGEAGFTASFAPDGEGRPAIELSVIAELPLVCQASMEPYSQPIERRSELVVIEDLAEQDTLAEGVEPVLAESGHIVLQDLIEDELLLALPQVPRRPGLDTVAFSTGGEAGATGTEQDVVRPFAGLDRLLAKQSREADND